MCVCEWDLGIVPCAPKPRKYAGQCRGNVRNVSVIQTLVCHRRRVLPGNTFYTKSGQIWVYVCVWLYIRAWSCIRSLIHGRDSPLASPASNRHHLGTCAKVPQCFPNTCTEKQDFPDFPAVLTWPTPPESSSQAFSKPFIWYHNISANPSLPPSLPCLSGFFTAACFHSAALTKTGEIITAGPKLGLSPVISTKNQWVRTVS